MTTAKYRKIVILGHISVGKTALVLQFVKGEFPKLYEPTIENTYNKSFVLEMEEYNLTVVDTASHLEFSFLPPSFFIGVDGYIVVYSVDSLTSFQMASVLHQKLEERRGKGCLPIVLVGNKKDVPARCRQVSPLEGLRLADAWKAPFLEVSATDPKETKQIFIELIKEIDRIERNFNKKKKCNIL
ncbi:GTPase RhebL1-like isoform 1-T1 [Mantella aurantiaca]